MKRQLIFWLAVSVILSACSDGSLDANASTGGVDQSQKQGNAVFPGRKLPIGKPAAGSSSNSSAVQSPSGVDSATKQPEVEKPQQEGADAEFALAMQQVEEELAKIDDSKLLQHYGAEGSALGITNRPLKLVRTAQTLVSNVSSVSGATSIIGDPTGFGFTVGLSGDYLFEFDKHDLTPEAQESLESVLALYKEYEGQEISIIGHTDAKGSKEYNQGLSERRAVSVKTWFVKSSIDPSIIKTQGLGEREPIAPNTKNGKDFPEGRAQNRRVEIKVKTNKKVNHLPTVSDKEKINR